MAETITIPISEYGYAALSASVPQDFGAVQDCEVYYIPHYSYAELRLKRVKGVAPAHFGVLIAVPKGVKGFVSRSKQHVIALTEEIQDCEERQEMVWVRVREEGRIMNLAPLRESIRRSGSLCGVGIWR